MQCQMDLRYVVPLLINLFFLFFPSPGSVTSPFYWDQNNGFNAILQYPTPLLLLVLTIVVVLLILYISIKVSVNIDSILLQTGDFSAAVAFFLLASFVVSPPIFLLLFLVFLLASPWRQVLFNLLNQFFRCFHQTLQSLYTLTVIRMIAHQPPRNAESSPPAYRVGHHQEVLLEIEDNNWGLNGAQ